MGSDKKTLWVQATVLILLAGLAYVMIALYARGYGHAVAPGVELGADGQPVQNAPGAPTRAQVNQLHDALRKKLGTNARGLSRVASVDYDGWPDRLMVVFALDRSPMTMTAAQAVELRPMVDVLQAVHAGGLQWRRLLLCATAPIDNGGTIAESTVVRAEFERAKLDRVDWSRFTAEGLPGLAQQFTVEPVLAELRPAEAKPVDKKPATMPATVPVVGIEKLQIAPR